jgi:NAD-dependent protein deacetylase/lipoamidase
MNPIERAASLLGDARHAIALTGAGMSTRSGIPDFRSPGSGIWEQVDPLEVASIFAFRRSPETFFNWIRPMARQLLTAQPNPAHLALAQLEVTGLIQAVITQNIDGLHQKAGNRRVLEVHGHLREATCIRCYHVFSTEQFAPAFLADGGVPRCPDCGNVLKPNVILYGEQLPATVMWEAQRYTRQCDLMLVAGSSLEVVLACDLPRRARQHGARLILVNLQPTYMDDQADVTLHADVTDVLPQIVQACGTPLTEHG